MAEEKLAEYNIIKSLGKGAFGEAHLIEHKQSQLKYVLKIINTSDMTMQDREDALSEAILLRRFNHPNIVSYHDMFSDITHIYIIMEYADAGDLRRFVETRALYNLPLTEDHVLYYFVQMLLALKHVHDKRILHRDLKGQNIFLTSFKAADGQTRIQVKLGDFGLAKVLLNPNSLAKSQAGTPYYLSPEIIRDTGYNNKSDVWSLGCLLYELCTFQRVFDAKSLGNLLMKILNETQKPIDDTRFSQDLQDLLNQMLLKNPDQRPSIAQILQLPFIKKWVEKLLPLQTINSEFKPEEIKPMKFLQNTQIGILQFLMRENQFNLKFGDEVAMAQFLSNIRENQTQVKNKALEKIFGEEFVKKFKEEDAVKQVDQAIKDNPQLLNDIFKAAVK
ncbi:Kinase [Hexamita inflata]|uniref:non-specific serine/threonine protein kinase n=1 Tax=Hexamita inflata TaxID=28002 RepID=A0AA86QQS6_9EUKA|nr:Kinase [Hexamita inflata]